jgi:adenylate kinase family enzyme
MQPKRILIVEPSGVGKSTLARYIGACLGLPISSSIRFMTLQNKIRVG